VNGTVVANDGEYGSGVRWWVR